MKRAEIREKLQYISADGIVHELHDPPKRTVLSQTGWGIPPYIMNTTRGPFQHGESPNIFRLSPRTVDVEIRHNECNRTGYWGIRSTLVDTLRPNRASVTDPQPGHLRRIYFVNGVKQVRQLDVFLTAGPVFQNPVTNLWDHWSVQEPLVFTAYNPVVYDPTQVSVMVAGPFLELTPPVTFPFVLGVYESDTTITYTGTWTSYPTITINGPLNNFTIINTATNQRLSLNYDVSAGEIVTIDLSYGSKTITNNFGQNLIGYLTTNSDLGSFAIEPDPLVAGGVNTFMTYTDNLLYDSRVYIKYYTCYIGI